MGAEPEDLGALRREVDADPSNDDARLRLASALSERGLWGDALEQARVVLSVHPASLDALGIAHRAAHGLGDLEATLGYRRLLVALGAGVDALGVGDGDRMPVDAPTLTRQRWLSMRTMTSLKGPVSHSLT